jgi:hypothetical protein
MNTEPNHDEVIDQVLAALRRAAPPEGMEARIAARIAGETASPAPGRRRLASLTPSAAWWRGAIAGGVAATLLLSAAAFIRTQFKAFETQAHVTVKKVFDARQATTKALSPDMVQVNQSQSAACPAPAVRRVRIAIASYMPPSLPIASFAPSHPPPVLPPTTQERELLQVARTVDPKILASLNPESQARLEAEDREQFNKFFAAPPAPQSTNANQ